MPHPLARPSPVRAWADGPSHPGARRRHRRLVHRVPRRRRHQRGAALDRGRARRRTRPAAVGGGRVPADARLVHPARRLAVGLVRPAPHDPHRPLRLRRDVGALRARADGRRVRHRPSAAGRSGRPARAELARAHHRHVPQVRAGPRDRAMDGVDHERVPDRTAVRRGAGRPPLVAGRVLDQRGADRGRPRAHARVRARRAEPEPRADRLARRGARRDRARRHGVRPHRAGALRLGFADRVRAARRRPRRPRGVRAVGATSTAADAAAQPVRRQELRRRQPRHRLHLRVVLARALRDDDLPAADGGLLGDGGRARHPAAHDHARAAGVVVRRPLDAVRPPHLHDARPHPRRASATCSPSASSPT